MQRRTRVSVTSGNSTTPMRQERSESHIGSVTSEESVVALLGLLK